MSSGTSAKTFRMDCDLPIAVRRVEMMPNVSSRATHENEVKKMSVIRVLSRVSKTTKSLAGRAGAEILYAESSD